MRTLATSALTVAIALAGCGGGDSELEPGAQRGVSEDPRTVPSEGYTCGELRSAAYRERQAKALLDEAEVRDPEERARLERRVKRALARICEPGPDYRRPARDVAYGVLRDAR